MKKGEIIEGMIERVQFPNKGILRYKDDHDQNYTVTVKNALPGQKVRVRITKKHAGRADGQLLEVVERAPYELPLSEVPCPKHDVCGGCTYLTLPYDQELSLKQIQVMELLQKAVDEANKSINEATAAADGAGTGSADTPCDTAELPENNIAEPPVAPVPVPPVTSWYEGIYSSPRIFGFRNKMEFTFGDEYKDGPLTLGMHRKGSFYDLADASECVIVDADYRAVIRLTIQFFRNRNMQYFHRARHTGYLRHLLMRKASHTGEILIDLITSSQIDPADEQALLKEYTDGLLQLEKTDGFEGRISGILHTRNDSVADTVQDEGTEILYGKDFFEESLLGLKFVVTPFSFFQTNSYSAEVLYELAREWINQIVYSGELETRMPGCADIHVQGSDPDAAKGSDPIENIGRARRPVIFDLYCGTGTISQLVAPVASDVIGVEIVPEAVEAAKENAVRNGISNCQFIAGDVLKVIDEIEEKPDLIILDPPRDGIHPKALPKITAYGVPYILYISCKPTSLARDLPYLIHAGYRPVRCASVDQFVWSANVETICLLKHI